MYGFKLISIACLLELNYYISFPAYTTTRTLHRGLDADSDVDDGSESTVPIRATPLTSRGGTPLGRSSTPLCGLRNRSTLTAENTRGGYTLAKGAIAEDIEEEDEKPKSSCFDFFHLLFFIMYK